MTLFFRLLEAPVDQKSSALQSAISSVSETGTNLAAVFRRDPKVFSGLPGSPFAYWVSNAVRGVFEQCKPFESDTRTVKQGLATTDDARFVRAWWEVSGARLDERWFGFAKGGAFSRFFADIHLVVDWQRDGRQSWAIYEARKSVVGGIIKNPDYYFRPGVTWPLRGIRLSAQAVPSGCIFSVGGKMAFAQVQELPAVLALFNSSAFDYLVNTRAGKVGGVQYQVGLVQQTPVPELSEAEAQLSSQLARRAWSLRRSLDTINETSHAFLLPEGINGRVTGLDADAVQRELDQIQREIDDQAFRLYGISDADRAVIEASAKHGPGAAESDAEAVDSEEDTDQDNPLAAAPADSLFSWLVGVAFGRFDARLATSARPPPPEPDPFDALPARSPGMWPEDEERSILPPDILVDDPGHNDDIRSRVASAAAGTGIPEPHDLRQWLAKQFFPLHIKMYSKSQRNAPIYWQLATPSGSYSAWLYIHAFNADTFFRVQNDYAAPKLAVEERRLESLALELREQATAAQRKALATQAAFVDELRAFLEEVKRLTPLWNPNLDDGVVINFAPLWRLVPQHKAWQRELKTTWDALCQGKYDWAHLAMHLWPERVIPKCAKDRSLAIAHGVEEIFWVEGNDGKWGPRKTPTQSTEKLISERSSPATKAALKSLLEAPAVGRGKAGRRGKKS